MIVKRGKSGEIGEIMRLAKGLDVLLKLRPWDSKQITSNQNMMLNKEKGQ
jgi:hypothetical protein